MDCRSLMETFSKELRPLRVFNPTKSWTMYRPISVTTAHPSPAKDSRWHPLTAAMEG
jgi:hypothetical protein